MGRQFVQTVQARPRVNRLSTSKQGRHEDLRHVSERIVNRMKPAKPKDAARNEEISHVRRTGERVRDASNEHDGTGAKIRDDHADDEDLAVRMMREHSGLDLASSPLRDDPRPERALSWLLSIPMPSNIGTKAVHPSHLHRWIPLSRTYLKDRHRSIRPHGPIHSLDEDVLQCERQLGPGDDDEAHLLGLDPKTSREGRGEKERRKEGERVDWREERRVRRVLRRCRRLCPNRSGKLGG
jgi:hypothetical protein